MTVSDHAWLETWLLDDSKRAIQILDSALTGGVRDFLEVDDRPYLELARAYAIAGSVDRARQLVKAFDAALPVARRPSDVQNRQLALGEIAIAERRYDAAIEALRLLHAVYAAEPRPRLRPGEPPGLCDRDV